MPKDDFDFEQDIEINLDNLHEEWRTHAQIRYSYAKEAAYLDMKVKQQRKLIEVKKTQLKEVISKLILQVKGDNPKFTVQQIDATIVGHEQIQTPEGELLFAQDELIEFEYEVNMAKNALQAFDDRKEALENEVKLWIRNYFSSPTEERQINLENRKPDKSITAESKDKATQKARTGMNKRRSRK